MAVAAITEAARLGEVAHRSTAPWREVEALAEPLLVRVARRLDRRANKGKRCPAIGQEKAKLQMLVRGPAQWEMTSR
jgi:hypothetical protein